MYDPADACGAVHADGYVPGNVRVWIASDVELQCRVRDGIPECGAAAEDDGRRVQDEYYDGALHGEGVHGNEC